MFTFMLCLILRTCSLSAGSSSRWRLMSSFSTHCWQVNLEINVRFSIICSAEFKSCFKTGSKENRPLKKNRVRHRNRRKVGQHKGSFVRQLSVLTLALRKERVANAVLDHLLNEQGRRTRVPQKRQNAHLLLASNRVAGELRASPTKHRIVQDSLFSFASPPIPTSQPCSHSCSQGNTSHSSDHRSAV